MQEYINVVVAVNEEEFDLVTAAVSDYQFIGITEGLDELTLCFDRPENEEDFIGKLKDDIEQYASTASNFRYEVVQRKNWNEEWEKSLKPAYIGDSIVVVPEHLADSVDAELTIVVTPKMSFGTGHHQTTALVLGFLQEHVAPGQRWIDAGTGTGVLAIGAIKLGAGSVFAFDFDEWSVANTLENLSLNQVSSTQCIVLEADVFTVELPISDGIVANLHRHVILPNLDRFYTALESGGPLIVSGLLKYDVDEVVTEAQRVGFQFLETRIDGEWAAVCFKKP